MQMYNILKHPTRWDLSWVTWIDPYGLVGLACMLDEIRRRGHQVSITLPTEDRVCRYLARMAFGEAVERADARLDRSLPSIVVEPRPEYVLELTRFNDMSAGENLANLIFERLVDTTRPEIVEALFEAAVELGMNAAEHAESQTGAYMAAFTHHRGEAKEFLVLAVGDTGIGIRRSLAKALQVGDDADAVERALERHISGTGSPGRGQGLPEVSDYVRRLHGWLVLRSGEARRQVGPEFSRTLRVVRFPGTFVGAWLPCASVGVQ